MNFSLIVPIPNISNTGEILKPTEILIKVEYESQFLYFFRIFTKYPNMNESYFDITELYESLVGTAPDCDKRFTEPIEAHLEMLFNDKKKFYSQPLFNQ